MRIKIRQENFPTEQQILHYVENSKYSTKLLIAVSILYRTWKLIAETMGFSLVRFQFEEIDIIIHKQPLNTWVIDFSICIQEK